MIGGCTTYLYCYQLYSANRYIYVYYAVKIQDGQSTCVSRVKQTAKVFKL